MSDGGVEFFGETFTVRDPDQYEVAMLDFADAATNVDSETLEGLASVKRFLRAAIAEDEWSRFWNLARKNRAKVKDDLMPLVVTIFQGNTGRPTGRSSDSSDGPEIMSESSAAVSSSVAQGAEEYLQVVARLEAEGRPDQAYMVLKAQQARAQGASV